MKTLFSSLSVAALLGSGLMHSAEAAVVYREIFSNTTGAGAGLQSSGWVAYTGATATLVNGAVASGVFLDNRNGSPINVDNTANNNPVAPASLAPGFVTTSTGVQLFLAYTTEFSLDLSAQSAASVSWLQGNPTGATQRLAIQVGGNWYATDTAFSNAVPVTSGNNMTSGAQLQSVDLFASTGANWRAVTFSPGTSLVVGGSAVTITGLTSSTITAFGIINEVGYNTNSRFDTFTIDATAVPEPAATALVGVSLAALVLRRRTRR